MLPLVRKESLEALYVKYHHRKFVDPDPLQFLYHYPELRDREIVGLIASSLAYGRVSQILKSVSSILERMRPSPYAFLMNTSLRSMVASFSDFRHRFTTGEDLSSILWGVRGVIRDYGSLYACFLGYLKEDHDSVLPALTELVRVLNGRGGYSGKFLLPDPQKGSACKRLNLFLRWMVREDEVDPGGWSLVSASKLIVPLDTHMHRIGRALLLTGRGQADMRSAMDMTHVFRGLAPDDPVRYDFALTRLGIREDTDMDTFLRDCAGRGAT